MKKNRTKILSLLLAALFIFFAVASGSEETKEQEKGKADPTEAKDDSSIGDYKVEILRCRLSKDYDGKDVVIITYNFTNISDEEPASFMWTFEDKVYQNGIECEHAYILDDDSYNSENKDKEIKAGASLEVECAYILNDTTSDIEVEVSELISLNSTTVKKTFEIS